jgi:hypothetical protein
MMKVFIRSTSLGNWGDRESSLLPEHRGITVKPDTVVVHSKRTAVSKVRKTFFRHIDIIMDHRKEHKRFNNKRAHRDRVIRKQLATYLPHEEKEIEELPFEHAFAKAFESPQIAETQPLLFKSVDAVEMIKKHRMLTRLNPEHEDIEKDLQKLEDMYVQQGYSRYPISHYDKMPLEERSLYVGVGLIGIAGYYPPHIDHTRWSYETESRMSRFNTVFQERCARPKMGVKIRKSLVRIYIKFGKNQNLVDYFKMISPHFVIVKSLEGQVSLSELFGGFKSLFSRCWTQTTTNFTAFLDSVKQFFRTAFNSIMDKLKSYIGGEVVQTCIWTLASMILLGLGSFLFYKSMMWYHIRNSAYEVIQNKQMPIVTKTAMEQDVQNINPEDFEATSLEAEHMSGRKAQGQVGESVTRTFAESVKVFFSTFFKLDAPDHVVQASVATKIGTVNSLWVLLERIAKAVPSIIESVYTFFSGQPLFDSTKIKMENEKALKEYTQLCNNAPTPIPIAMAEAIFKAHSELHRVAVASKHDNELLARISFALKTYEKVRDMASAIVQGKTMRTEPFVVYMTGMPGASKTSLIEIFSRMFATKVENETFDSSMLFNRKQENEFWDGYVGQKYVCMDDAFQNADPNTRAILADAFISLVNRAPYQLHMSKTTDKADTYFNSKYIFVTCNRPFHSPFPTDLGITDPNALYRRFHFPIYVGLRQGADVYGKCTAHYMGTDEATNHIAQCIYFEPIEKINGVWARNPAKQWDFGQMAAAMFAEMQRRHAMSNQAFNIDTLYNLAQGRPPPIVQMGPIIPSAPPNVPPPQPNIPPANNNVPPLQNNLPPDPGTGVFPPPTNFVGTTPALVGSMGKSLMFNPQSKPFKPKLMTPAPAPPVKPDPPKPQLPPRKIPIPPKAWAPKVKEEVKALLKDKTQDEFNVELTMSEKTFQPTLDPRDVGREEYLESLEDGYTEEDYKNMEECENFLDQLGADYEAPDEMSPQDWTVTDWTFMLPDHIFADVYFTPKQEKDGLIYPEWTETVAVPFFNGSETIGVEMHPKLVKHFKELYPRQYSEEKKKKAQAQMDGTEKPHDYTTVNGVLRSTMHNIKVALGKTGTYRPWTESAWKKPIYTDTDRPKGKCTTAVFAVQCTCTDPRFGPAKCSVCEAVADDWDGASPVCHIHSSSTNKHHMFVTCGLCGDGDHVTARFPNFCTGCSAYVCSPGKCKATAWAPHMMLPPTLTLKPPFSFGTYLHTAWNGFAPDTSLDVDGFTYPTTYIDKVHQAIRWFTLLKDINAGIWLMATGTIVVKDETDGKLKWFINIRPLATVMSTYLSLQDTVMEPATFIIGRSDQAKHNFNDTNLWYESDGRKVRKVYFKKVPGNGQAPDSYKLLNEKDIKDWPQHAGYVKLKAIVKGLKILLAAAVVVMLVVAIVKYFITHFFPNVATGESDPHGYQKKLQDKRTKRILRRAKGQGFADQKAAKFRNNIIAVAFNRPNLVPMRSYLFFVSGYVAAAAGHAVPENFTSIDLIDCVSEGGHEIVIRREDLQLHRMPGRDLVYIQFAPGEIDMFKDLTKHMKTKEERKTTYREVVRIRPQENEQYWLETAGKAQHFGPNEPLELENVNLKVIDGYEVRGLLGQKGYCGLPYASNSDSDPKSLIGIHNAGNSTSSFFVPIFKEDLSFLTKADGQLSESDFWFPKCTGLEVDETKVTSPIPGLRQVGEMNKNFYMPSKNPIIPSPLQEGFRYEGQHYPNPYKITKVPTRLAPGKDENGVMQHPLKNAVTRFAKRRCPPKVSLTDEMTDKCFKGCFHENFDWEAVTELTLDEAINGDPESLHIHAVDVSASSSVGFSERGITTDKLFPFKDPKDVNSGRTIHPDLKEWYDHEQQEVLEDRIPPLFCIGTLKYETKPKGKEWKPRIFANASKVHLLRSKVSLARLFEQVLNHGGKGDVYVGITPQSYDWTALCMKLLSKHHKVDCTDAEAWDMNFVIWFGSLMADYVRRQKGWTIEDPRFKRLRAVIISTLCHYLIIGRALYKNLGMPSGCYATAVLNSMLNSFMIRFCWYIVYPDVDFDLANALATFGDDLSNSTNPSYEQWDGQVSALMCTKYFGIKKTTITKDGKEIPKNLPLYMEDWTYGACQFLQRGFRYENALIKPVLNRDSIESMLLWYDSSSVSEGLTKEQLMSQIVSTALVEYSYYGEEEYEKQRSFLTKYMRTMIPGWTFEKSYQSLHNAIFDS